MTRHCTFGIEEEYLLVKLATGQVMAVPSAAVARCCWDAAGPWFAEEMFHSQIEIASPVFDALHQARDFFGERRQRLARALADEGAGLTDRPKRQCFGGYRVRRTTDHRARQPEQSGHRC
ncbi:carboxylate-amine ligase [Pseudomonas putida DOT-T1E]|uniref:Carboxylate-amine ligase n=1 Tax=Pseudomonas putida (strain DOT-T1E) TaxID=1196325 RepID=I7CFQ1_PSEPT|nr:carboxylate-amine ligase [Pseudomonas putida DOT-T1E]